MLLDEPTNNLDRAARAMVADIVARWNGGVVVASHDRALLRKMDRILELSSLGARLYGGGWDLYAGRRALEDNAAREHLEAAQRQVRRARREAQEARERKDRRDAAGRRSRLRGDAPRILLDARAERAEHTGARLGAVAERQRRVAEETLIAAQTRLESVRTIDFGLPSCGLAAAKLALAFEEVDFVWNRGAPILAGISFRLTGPKRIAVAGPNGSGKTTLVRLAGGTLTPTGGHVVRGVASVTLDQRAALLWDEMSLRDNFQRLNPEADQNAAQAALARFLFRNVQAERPAGELSGGERLRAALACVLMAQDPPKLIILDEPTNHLDLGSIAAIEGALADYDGAILVVSHDDDFLATIGAETNLELG
jgi:ATPase subunit of ABC transporter with duplicated ATPase domains